MSRKQEGNTVIQVEVEKELGLKMRNCAKARGLTRERFYRECLMDGYKSRQISQVEKESLAGMTEMKKFAIKAKKMKAINDCGVLTSAIYSLHKQKERQRKRDKDIEKLLKDIEKLAKVINGI